MAANFCFPSEEHRGKNPRRICIQNDLWARFVSLPTQDRIWTLTVTHTRYRDAPKCSRTPLVMVHGFGGGVGLWIRNLDPLCRSRPIFAFDLLGFGRSSHPRFPPDPVQAEQQSVVSIEHWRRALGLETMILLGHSLGVRHLILVDPWGFEPVPPGGVAKLGFPRWVEILLTMASFFNPLAVVRATGPWGPKLIGQVRPDFKRNFEELFQDDTVMEYIYHCNAQTPSGKVGFRAMSVSLLWAKKPMLERVHLLSPDLPVTLVYGGRSWMDSTTGEQVTRLRPNSYTHTVVFEGAPHHVYADKPEAFNAVVQSICDTVD